MIAKIAGLIASLALLSGAQLPHVTTETLAGNKIDLPSEIDGSLAVLCIGFTHGSQAQTSSWSKNLQPELSNHRGVVFYSVAVLQDVPRLVRPMVVHSIKSGVPAAKYSHFLLVYKDEKELKEAAGFGPEDDAYLVVIDKAGTIQYKGHGPPSAAAIRELANHLQVPR